MENKIESISVSRRAETNKKLMRAEELIEAGDYSNAINILNEILKEDSANIDALNDLAVIGILQKEYALAKSFLDMVLQIEPGNEIAEGNMRHLGEMININSYNEPERVKDTPAEDINWEEGYQHFCKGEGIEIGCGGKPLPGLSSKQVDLIDDYNGFKYHVDFLAPADDLSFSKGDEFDYIVHSNMIEHLANPVKALLEWHRVLKAGGILYMIIPDKRLWITDRQRNVSYPQEWGYAYKENRSNRPEFPNTPNTHFFAYTPEIFKQCLAETKELNRLFEISGMYTNSEKVINQIVEEVNEFVPNGDHMFANYTKIQNIQKANGAYGVGHSFHVVLKAVK